MTINYESEGTITFKELRSLLLKEREEQRFSITNILEFVPTLTIENHKEKVGKYFRKLTLLFKERQLPMVANYIKFPQDPEEFPQDPWDDKINDFVLSVLEYTADDYYFCLKENATGQENLYNLMTTTNHVIDEYKARNMVNSLTYSHRMNFTHFQCKVHDVMSLANRSNCPVDDRIIISTIIGNMKKSAHTANIGTDAIDLKKNKRLPDFIKFLKRRWEDAQLKRYAVTKRTNKVRKINAKNVEEKKRNKAKNRDTKNIVSAPPKYIKATSQSNSSVSKVLYCKRVNTPEFDQDTRITDAGISNDSVEAINDKQDPLDKVENMKSKVGGANVHDECSESNSSLNEENEPHSLNEMRDNEADEFPQENKGESEEHSLDAKTHEKMNILQSRMESDYELLSDEEYQTPAERDASDNEYKLLGDKVIEYENKPNCDHKHDGNATLEEDADAPRQKMAEASQTGFENKNWIETDLEATATQSKLETISPEVIQQNKTESFQIEPMNKNRRETNPDIITSASDTESELLQILQQNILKKFETKTKINDKTNRYLQTIVPKLDFEFEVPKDVQPKTPMRLQLNIEASVELDSNITGTLFEKSECNTYPIKSEVVQAQEINTYKNIETKKNTETNMNIETIKKFIPTISTLTAKTVHQIAKLINGLIETPIWETSRKAVVYIDNIAAKNMIWKK